MAEREGFESLGGVEKREVVDSQISMMSRFRTFEGFVVQNRVQGMEGERTKIVENVCVIFWRYGTSQTR